MWAGIPLDEPIIIRLNDLVLKIPAGSDDTVTARARSILTTTGDRDAITVAGTGVAVTVAGTGETLSMSNGSVFVGVGSSFAPSGANDAVAGGANVALDLSGTSHAVTLGNSTITLEPSAQASERVRPEIRDIVSDLVLHEYYRRLVTTSMRSKPDAWWYTVTLAATSSMATLNRPWP